MGTGYTVRCTACGYHRDLLLGQGDDAFYEFYEEVLYVCFDCRQLTVVTTPRPYDMLVYMREEGFTKPWSGITSGDDPELRAQHCTELIACYLAGDFDEMQCNHCGSTNLEACEGIPLTCPQCESPSLGIVEEFDWS